MGKVPVKMAKVQVPVTMAKVTKESESPTALVPRILNSCRESSSGHPRAIRQLVACRQGKAEEFLKIWLDCLRPMFVVREREPLVERILNLVAMLTAYWDEEHARCCESFFRGFISKLLDWAQASNKVVRYRACQVISEVMKKLDDRVVIDEELWDRMQSVLHSRMQDIYVPVRVFAASAVSRLVIGDDVENDKTVQAYRHAIMFDPSAEVRKMVVKSFPPTNATVSDVVERIADVSEAVRVAAYQTIGEKFSIVSLSIMQRAKILARGLAERVPAVRAECVNLLDLWLREDCNGDPLVLLRFLDVETYESVGETVMSELLKEKLITLKDSGLRQFLGQTSGVNPHEERLMDPEQALFWRVLCIRIHTEAKAKSRHAAVSRGTEAALSAEDATEKNDYLDRVLPASVADFVRLVEAHLHRGQAARFAARQLLLLARLLDFADITGRKNAAALLQRLLEESPSEHDGSGWVGDGISLGGEESWANAVAEMARHVHAASRELEDVLAASVAEIARPCREGGADVGQWLHCLAVTSLLLENIRSIKVLKGLAIEPDEIMHSLLLPAVKHIQPEVQRAGVRCLGIFCALERSPSSRGVEQLRFCLLNGRPQVQKMALKSVFEVILSHGPAAVDGCYDGERHSGLLTPRPQAQPHQIPNLVEAAILRSNAVEKHRLSSPVLELLEEWLDSEALGEDGLEETFCFTYTTSITAECFAKVLMRNKRFPEIQLMQDRIVEKLLVLYFSDSTKQFPRLRQCLQVFFRTWCSLSSDNKRCISSIFISIMRKIWPGISINSCLSSPVLLARKQASQDALFMLHLILLPITRKATRRQVVEEHTVDEGQETLAINICIEAKEHANTFTALSRAWKTYVAMLFRVVSLLEFQAAQQEKIKALLNLLQRLISWVPASEKGMLKDLNLALGRAKDLDKSPDKGMTDEELELFMVQMGFDKMKDKPGDESPCTPEEQCEGITRGAARKSRDLRFAPASIQRARNVAGIRRKNPTAASTRKKASAKVETSSEDSEEISDDISDDEESNSEDDESNSEDDEVNSEDDEGNSDLSSEDGECESKSH